MDRIDKLMMKANELREPKLRPFELAMRNNPYSVQQRETLIELLSKPMDDWRQVVQALAWMGGG